MESLVGRQKRPPLFSSFWLESYCFVFWRYTILSQGCNGEDPKQPYIFARSKIINYIRSRGANKSIYEQLMNTKWRMPASGNIKCLSQCECRIEEWNLRRQTQVKERYYWSVFILFLHVCIVVYVCCKNYIYIYTHACISENHSFTCCYHGRIEIQDLYTVYLFATHC